MSTSQSIVDFVQQRAWQKRRKIGITILEESEEIINSLLKAQEFADIVVYSDHQVGDLETKVLEGEDDIIKTLVQDYKQGEIDQFVRGQVDDFNTEQEFKDQFGISKEEKRLAFAIVEDVKGNQFVLAIASNPEGQNYDDKQRILDGVTKWMQNEVNITPRVAVMATCRPQSVGKDPMMTQSYEDAENLVKFLSDKGVEAQNIHIELQKAVPWANVVAASNGAIGNQIFRAMVLLGGGKAYFIPAYYESGYSYEENSRNEQDYYHHIMFACSLANKE